MVPPVIGQDGTPVVPMVNIVVDKHTVEAAVAVAPARGVEAVDAGPETAILASLHTMIPHLPLPLCCTALFLLVYRHTSVGGGGVGRVGGVGRGGRGGN